MDLDLSPDQELFRETTRKFLEAQCPIGRVRELIEDPVGMDRDAWRQGAELGWFSMLVPEEYGGGSVSGVGIRDLAIVAEELGRVLFPGPVLATGVVAFAIAEAGTDDQRAQHLPAIATGETIATWAFSEGNERWDSTAVALEAVPDGDGWRLSGVKTPVEYGAVAELLLVTARTPGGLTQFLVPAESPGVTVAALVGLDLARRFSEVSFDGVVVGPDALLGSPGGVERAVERQLQVAAALQCAETVGALDVTFDMTLQYMKDRRAFGRPIGSFQALKHRAADMLLWLESSKAVAVAAVEAVQFDVDAGEVVHIAKSYIGERGPAIIRECLQFHGGIGYTWEHDIHLYLRRVESNAALYGDTATHRDRLAELVGL